MNICIGNFDVNHFLIFLLYFDVTICKAVCFSENVRTAIIFIIFMKEMEHKYKPSISIEGDLSSFRGMCVLHTLCGNIYINACFSPSYFSFKIRQYILKSFSSD